MMPKPYTFFIIFLWASHRRIKQTRSFPSHSCDFINSNLYTSRMCTLPCLIQVDISHRTRGLFNQQNYREWNQRMKTHVCVDMLRAVLICWLKLNFKIWCLDSSFLLRAVYISKTFFSFSYVHLITTTLQKISYLSHCAKRWIYLAGYVFISLRCGVGEDRGRNFNASWV